jgi:hypothetical protein
MWAAKDNGSPISWPEAKKYCENYRGGGYMDWRMPTQDELAGLYDKSKSYRVKKKDYIVHLTELIEITNCCPWASDADGPRFGGFNFDRGWGAFTYPGSYMDRVLPVRSGK